jgi:hypothetical protein
MLREFTVQTGGGGSDVDPDPEKIVQDPGRSGSEMNLKKNYVVKLIKFDNFSRKC